MKRLFLSFAVFAFISLAAVADTKQEALDFFNSYVNGANSYSPVIVDMYSPSAKIIRQVVKPDGTTVDINTDTATYIKQMKLGQAGAKLRKYKNTYTNITATPVEGGYKVSSLRQPSGEDNNMKAYMIVKKQPNGKWLITEEMMQTKVQTLLRYADKN